MGEPSSSSLGDQVRYGRCTLAPKESSLLSTEVSLYLSLFVFYYFGSFGRANSPSSISFPFLFLFCRFGPGSKPRGEGKGGRVGLGGSWVIGTSLDGPPFLLATRFLRPLLGFKAISTSSSELVSTRATTGLGDWAAENLSKSALESKSSTYVSSTSPSSSRWNWYSLRDRCVEAVSSLGAATSWGTRWMGNSIGGRSLWAKNAGLEMSKRANLGSPALIAWPTS